MEQESKDEKFAQFINAYSLSWAANHFITIMNPEQRVKFFVAIAQTYPNEWQAATAQLVNSEPETKR